MVHSWLLHFAATLPVTGGYWILNLFESSACVLDCLLVMYCVLFVGLCVLNRMFSVPYHSQ